MRSHTSGRLALATALATLLAIIVVPGAAATTFSGSITASDPTHPGFLSPSAASSCLAPYVPGVGGGVSFHYDTYTLTNQSASCVTVGNTASITSSSPPTAPVSARRTRS